MEKMTISELPQSTQAFVVSKPTINSNNDDENSVGTSTSHDEQLLTQAFTTVPMGPPITLEVDPPLPTITTTNVVESTSFPPIDPSGNKSHPTVTFQLAPPRPLNRPSVSTTSAIQPQVTSNDVQQMLLTFSADPSSTNEGQAQPMEAESEQLQEQRPTFSMPSSIESTISTEE